MIILRHDVDNPYSNKWLLYASLKVGFPSVHFLGYLKLARELFEFEKEHDVVSSWFFRTCAMPKTKFREELRKSRHETGFHADRINDVASFETDLKSMPSNELFLGFSKHGHKGLETNSSTGGEGEVYDITEKLYISRVLQLGLKYFSGNKPFCESQSYYIESGAIVFPCCFSVVSGYMDEKYTVDWLSNNCNKFDIVVNIHPEDFLMYPETVKKVYACDTRLISFEQYLQERLLIE
jgi:hypothetical protein